MVQGSGATVKSIFVKGKKVKKAVEGENNEIGLNKKLVGARGSVISSAKEPVNARKGFTARIFVTGKIGKTPRISLNGVETQCSSINVEKLIDTTTGNSLPGKDSKILGAILAKISLRNAIPFESFEQTRELGRFVLYNGNLFVGIGVVE